MRLSEYFELQRGGADNNLLSMEGIRGLAVFLVFLVHYVALADPWLAREGVTYLLAAKVHALGNVGVDLFFVLSGYLIYGSLIGAPQPFFPYFRRRLRRIYPAFATVFLLYVALSFVFPERSKLPRDTLDSIVYLTQNFLLLPGIFPIPPLITVAWSLSYEMLYYIVIPVVISVLGLRHWRTSRRVALFISLGTMMIAFPATVGGHPRLSLFMAGIVLFEAVRAKGGSNFGDVWGALGLLAGLIAAAVAGDDALIPGRWFLGVLCIGFFVFCLACFKPAIEQPSLLARAFRWTPLRWLGNMSYSFYLIHGLALQGAFMVLGMFFPPGARWRVEFWLMLAPMFFVATLVSAVLFVGVERPLSLVRLSSARGPTRSSALR